MNTSQTFFSDLSRHEKIKLVGHVTVQAGLFLIAVSAVLRELGRLPDTPINSTAFAESSMKQPNNTRGYFD